MKYKVGQKVRIKSLEWYKENRNLSGVIATGDTFFRKFMSRFCGSVVTIESIELVANLLCYRIKEDGGHYYWVDEMIEGLVEEETKPKYEDEVNGEYYSTPKYLVRPSGYQFVDENGNVINARKIVLEKKKKEYPKTYEECSKIAPMTWGGVNFKHYNELLSSFCKLLICRDAYWKIAGEEMGLGKPWEPDWTYNGATKYCIGVSENEIQSFNSGVAQYIFAFPTPEMRDAFKENFDPDIEICKELL